MTGHVCIALVVACYGTDQAGPPRLSSLNPPAVQRNVASSV
jgi:hypothetical protein